MTINAVAQAAAQGVPATLMSGRKVTAVAALAGFVLRLFRQRVASAVTPGTERTPPPPRRRGARRQGGLELGAGARPGIGSVRTPSKGGLRHG